MSARRCIALAWAGLLSANALLAQEGPGDGRMAVDPRVFAVSADQGSVLETVSDFALSSKGGPEVQWRGTRMFDQRTTGPGDTVQGYNWLNGYDQSLTLTGSPDPNAAVTWRADAHHSYLFSNSGSYTFAANDRTFGVLSHAHTGDAGDTYRIEFPNGTILVFWDNSHSPGAEKLKLAYVEDLYGNRLTIHHDSSTGNIDSITDPSGHVFEYAYLGSTGNAGKLETIKAFKSDPNDPNELIAQIEFTYKDSLDSYDAEAGTQGDLVKAVVKTHVTGEVGTSFGIVRTTAYRYWDGSTFNAVTHPGHAHELKAVIWPEHYQRADDDPNFTDPLTATDAQIVNYRTYAYEYDSSNRCSKVTVANGGASGGGGCGSCGGGGGGAEPGAYVLTYVTGGGGGRSGWDTRCKIEFNGWTRFIDVNSWGESFQDVLVTNASDANEPVWGVRYDRDPNTGQVTTLYSAAAISGYDDPNHIATLVSGGLVTDYTYDAGGKQLASSRVRKQSEATNDALYTGLWSYSATSGSFGYRNQRYLLTNSYVYPTETTTSSDPNRIATQYEYVPWADSDDLDGDANASESTDRPMVIKTTLPTVTSGQNGPNVAAERFVYLDNEGRVRWIKDEEGHVHYQSFNDLNGALTFSIRDVESGTTYGSLPTHVKTPGTDSGADDWAAWEPNLPAPKDLGASPAYDFQVSGGTYVQVESIRLLDLQGRLQRVARPNPVTGGTVYDFSAYLDGETRSYSAWEGTDPNKPMLPVQRTLTDKDGRVTQSITVDPNSITFSEPPTGGETLTDQTKWVSWSTTTYDGNLRRSSSRAYHTIPGSGSGSSGTNYYETTVSYADDSGTRTSTVAVRDHEGGYTRTTTNARGQTIKVEGTATESMGSPTSWKTLTESYFDQATPGTGATKGGPGNLTQTKSYYDDSNSNSTAMTYDWRNRRLRTTPPAAPYSLVKFDNMGRTVASATYAADPNISADPTTASDPNRLSLSETFYNNRGQVYETKQWGILQSGDPNAGDKGFSLVTDIYYDRAGRTVAVKSPGSGYMVTRYDGAGRVYQTLSCTAINSPAYDSGAFDYGDSIKVIEMSALTLNLAGQPTQVKRYELIASANTTLDPASPATNAIVTGQWNWYDAANRKIQSTDFGTTASGGLAGPMHPTGGGWTAAVAYDPSDPYPTTSNDTELMTKSTYLTNGRLDSVTNVSNKVTKYEYDAMGRKTAMVEDYGGIARRTDYEFNSSSQTKVTAENGAATDQQTQYVYGHAINSRWVTEIRYPDASAGTPVSSSTGKVVMTYNNDGTLATRTDQNGNVHTIEYDGLRRKTADRVSTLGSGVDGAVRRISTTYDSSGRVRNVTSYDDPNLGGGSVVNDVQYSYNGLGQLTQDAQEHAAAVDPNSLYVGYTWTEDAGDNHSRLDHMTYPNGRDLYSYYTNRNASSTYQNEIDDAFSRVGQLGNDPNGIYVDYTFAGRSRLIQRASPTGAGFKGNGTILDYDPGTAGEYAGLDFNGRVVNQIAHEDGDPNVIQSSMQYRSNPNGTPKFAEPQNSVVLGKADFYTYDGLERLSQIDAGRLNSGRTAITAEWSTPQSEVFTMDAVGNMTAIDHKNSGNSASESRTYNCLNQLTSRTITAQKPVYWLNDPFTDNNINQWVVADIVSGSDGTWSASSGKVQCDTVATVTSAPGNGHLSILLADIGALQDIQLSATVTLSSTAQCGGLVFGYRDASNYFLLIANKTSGHFELVECLAGTFYTRASAGTVGASTYNLGCEIRSGYVEFIGSTGLSAYSGTIPAGQVGVCAGSDTATIKLDNVKALNLAAFADVDGRFWDDVGDTSLSSGKLNFAVVTGIGSLSVEKRAIRRGFRGGKYVLEVDATTVDEQSRGVLLHYQDNENYMAVKLRGITTNFDGSVVTTPSLLKRVDGVVSTVYTGSNFNMSAGDRVICAIHDDPGNSALQELKVYVNGTLRLTSTGIDDTWSAGMCGLVMFNDCSSAVQFDNFKVGYDNNADDDCDDGGDDVQIDDNFSSNAITLTYDNNGNLTDDGIFLYVFDAWNRLVTAKRRVDATNTVATYAYDGTNRRTKYQIQNSGAEVVSNDGGDRTTHYWFTGQQPIESRNGSLQLTDQFVWGTKKPKDLVFWERSGDPTVANDSNPDVTASGESSETPADQRYFVSSDRNGKAVGLTVYDTGGSNNGQVAERYSVINLSHGPTIIRGDAGAGELGVAGDGSSSGNPQFSRLVNFISADKLDPIAYPSQSPMPGEIKCAYRWSRHLLTEAAETSWHLGIDVAWDKHGYAEGPSGFAGGCDRQPFGYNLDYYGGFYRFYVDYGAPRDNPSAAPRPNARACPKVDGTFSQIFQGSNPECDSWIYPETDDVCNALLFSLPRFWGYIEEATGTCMPDYCTTLAGVGRCSSIDTINNSNAGIHAAIKLARTQAPDIVDPNNSWLVNTNPPPQELAFGWSSDIYVSSQGQHNGPCSGFGTCEPPN